MAIWCERRNGRRNESRGWDLQTRGMSVKASVAFIVMSLEEIASRKKGVTAGMQARKFRVEVSPFDNAAKF